MYGRYTKDLGEYAKDEARRLKQLERQRKKDDRARDKVNEQASLRACRALHLSSVRYKATVVGIFRNCSALDEGGESIARFRGAGATRLQEWARTGYS